MRLKLILAVFCVFIINNSSTFSQEINKWNILDETDLEFASAQSNIDYFDENNIVLFGYNSYTSSIGRKYNYKIFHFSNKFQNKKIIYNDTSNVFDRFNKIKLINTNKIFLIGFTSEYLGNYQGNQFKNYGLLIYSSDSGNSWNRLLLDSNSVLRDMVMLNEKKGAILQNSVSNIFNNTFATSDTILLTDDSWKSYKKVNLPDGVLNCQQILYPSENNLLVLSYDVSSKKSYIIHSTNNGISWENVRYFNEDLNIIKLKYFNNNVAYAIGSKRISTIANYRLPKILKSNDGGSNWSDITPNLNIIGVCDRFDFIDDTNFLVSCGKFYLRTNDCGNNWSKENLPFPLNNLSYSISDIIYPSINFALSTLSSKYILLNENKKILQSPKFFSLENYYQSINSIKITWNSIVGANKYHLKIVGISRDSNNVISNYNFDNPEIDTIINDTIYEASNLKYNYQNMAIVKAIADTIDSDWSNTLYFITIKNEMEIIPPKLIYPNNNQIISDSKIKLIWNNPSKSDFFNISIENFSDHYIFFQQKNIKDTSIEITDFNPFKYWRVSLQAAKESVSDFSDNYFFTDKILDVYQNNNDIKKNIDINIYPNPVTESCKIKFISSSFLSSLININNLLGTCVYSQEYQINEGENIIQLSIENYPPGIYFVEVISSHDIKRGMFIKQ